jgi:hypothetical protein
MLFHCQGCPLAYCFDCCPDRYTTQKVRTALMMRCARSLLATAPQ